jgi:hypothetical protein
MNAAYAEVAASGFTPGFFVYWVWLHTGICPTAHQPFKGLHCLTCTGLLGVCCTWALLGVYLHLGLSLGLAAHRPFVRLVGLSYGFGRQKVI